MCDSPAMLRELCLSGQRYRVVLEVLDGVVTEVARLVGAAGLTSHLIRQAQSRGFQPGPYRSKSPGKWASLSGRATPAVSRSSAFTRTGAPVLTASAIPSEGRQVTVPWPPDRDR